MDWVALVLVVLALGFDYTNGFHDAANAVASAVLVGAILWNVTTWYFGLPSSSSHALIGGMVGAASVVDTTAFVFAAPVSTTHTVTSAVMGVGATQRCKAVRWSVAGDIATGWVLTFPGSAALAALAYTVLNLL